MSPDSSVRSLLQRGGRTGEELVAETMPLRHVRRVYRIDGPRPSAWYEVKNDLLPGLRMIGALSRESFEF